MKSPKAYRIILIGAAVMVVTGGFATAIPEDKKEIPDHTGFTSCVPCHAEKQSMWEASGHSKAIGRLANAKSTADCYACHSTEGFAAKLQGGKVDMNQKENFHTVSCLACHDPRGSKLPKKLVSDSDSLCESCHKQRAVLKGEGARGVDEMRSIHSGVPCISCHMTEGNHRMKVLRPDDPGLTEKRDDTCTVCHKGNTRKMRAQQIQEWQSDYQEKMAVLQAELSRVDTLLKAEPEALNASSKSKLEDIRFNLSILTRDGSRSAHNPDFALEIMSLASKTFEEIQKEVQSAPVSPR